MTIQAWQVSATVGLVAPAVLVVWGQPAWGWGIWLGEAAGVGSFLWINHTLPRLLTREPEISRWSFFRHSLARYALMGGLFYLAIRWDAIHIVGVLAGYAFSQWPAAQWRNAIPLKRDKA